MSAIIDSRIEGVRLKLPLQEIVIDGTPLKSIIGSLAANLALYQPQPADSI